MHTVGVVAVVVKGVAHLLGLTFTWLPKYSLRLVAICSLHAQPLAAPSLLQRHRDSNAPLSGLLAWLCFQKLFQAKRLEHMEVLTNVIAHQQSCFVDSLFMDKRPLMGRGPVRGPPQAPREKSLAGPSCKILRWFDASLGRK